MLDVNLKLMNFDNVKLDGNELVKQLLELKFVQSIDSELAELVHEGFKCLRYVTPKVLNYIGDYVRKKVPEQNRIIPDPRILKEVLENIAFITNKELHDMFLNLLASSCDSTKKDLAQPAYALILTQINRDEAEFIKKYYERAIRQKSLVISLDDEVREHESKYNMEEYELLSSYKEHLISLSILKVEQRNTGTNDSYEYIDISNFGLRFAQACIPSISSSSSIGA